MRKWLGIFILFFLLVIFYLLKDVNFYEVGNYFIQMDLQYFILACLSYFGTFLLGSLRIKYLCKDLKKINFFYMLKVTLAGSFVNTCTPGASIGGEPLKSYFLSKKYKKSQTKFLERILIDKFFYFFVFGFFLVFSILFILFYINIPYNLKIILQITLFSIFLIFVIFFIVTFKKFQFNLLFFAKFFYRARFIKNGFKDVYSFEKYLRKKLKGFKTFFKKTLKNQKIVFFSILLSVLNWLLLYFVSWFLFLSFGVNINFLSIIIVVTLGTLAGEVSPSPGGVGVTESAMFLLYSVMGINFSLAIIVTLMSRLIFYFYSLALGGISLVSLRLDLKKS